MPPKVAQWIKEQEEPKSYEKNDRTLEEKVIQPESIVTQTNKEIVYLVKKIIENTKLSPLQKEKIL